MKNAKLRSFKPRNLKPKSVKSKGLARNSVAQTKTQPVAGRADVVSADKKQKVDTAAISLQLSKASLFDEKANEEKNAANKALKVFVFIVIFILSEVLIPDFALMADMSRKKFANIEDRCLQNLILIANKVDDYNHKRDSKRAMKELDLSRLGIYNQVCGRCSYIGHDLDTGDRITDKIFCKTHGNKTKLEESIASDNRMKILARISLFIVKIIVISAICYVI